MVEKLETAINTQDADLFWSVGDSETADFYRNPVPVWTTVPYRADIRVTDVLEGKRHNYAIVFLEWMIQEDDGEPLVWDEESDAYGGTTVEMKKQDGRWMIENYNLAYLLNSIDPSIYTSYAYT